MKTPQQVQAFVDDLNEIVKKHNMFIPIDGYEICEILDNGSHDNVFPYAFVDFNILKKQYELG